MTKKCSRCKETKALGEFSRDSRAPSGLQYKCKLCQSALANAWNKAHPQKCQINNRNARARNVEKYRDDDRRRYERERDRRVAHLRAYYAANKKMYAEKRALRRLMFPDLVRAQSASGKASYRARLLGAPGSHTARQRADLYASYLNKCAYCDNAAAALDHVSPLIRGGCNHLENLAPACGSCNSSKGSKTLLEFLFKRSAG